MTADKFRPQSEIERLIFEADAVGQGAAYHVNAVYPDGSRVNAPIIEVGENWVKFAELREAPLVVDVLDAELTVDWNPGPSGCSGPRFEYLQAPTPAPR